VASFLLDELETKYHIRLIKFSSLSESGFIPTPEMPVVVIHVPPLVLISFREWLHSYSNEPDVLSILKRR